mgnify:CR=1 FL=1
MIPETNGGRIYRMVLFVDSTRPLCQAAAERLRELCLKHIPDAYYLEIFDLLVDQPLFEKNRVIAVPTLDVVTPESKTYRFVGDLVGSEVLIVAAGMTRTAIQQLQDAHAMERDVIKMRNGIRRMSPDRDSE